MTRNELEANSQIQNGTSFTRSTLKMTSNYPRTGTSDDAAMSHYYTVSDSSKNAAGKKIGGNSFIGKKCKMNARYHPLHKPKTGPNKHRMLSKKSKKTDNSKSPVTSDLRNTNHKNFFCSVITTLGRNDI